MPSFFDPLAEIREQLLEVFNPPFARQMRDLQALTGFETLRAQSGIPDLDVLRELGKAVNPGAIASEALRVGREMTLPIRGFGLDLKRLSDAFGPQIPLFVDLIKQMKEGARWFDDAPEKLKQAFSAAGMVPHPELSFVDIRNLIREFDNAGSDAAVARLLELHEELIASTAFREQVRVRWERVGRWTVLSEVLKAFDGGLYAVAIPAALAQVDGIVADAFELTGLRQDALKKRVAEMHENDGSDLYSPLAEVVLDGLLATFDHGSEVARLNRHAVLHGGARNYGTRANATTAIVWVDYVLSISEKTREHRVTNFRRLSRDWFTRTPDSE